MLMSLKNHPGVMQMTYRLYSLSRRSTADTRCLLQAMPVNQHAWIAPSTHRHPVTMLRPMPKGKGPRTLPLLGPFKREVSLTRGCTESRPTSQLVSDSPTHSTESTAASQESPLQ